MGACVCVCFMNIQQSACLCEASAVCVWTVLVFNMVYVLLQLSVLIGLTSIGVQSLFVLTIEQSGGAFVLVEIFKDSFFFLSCCCVCTFIEIVEGGGGGGGGGEMKVEDDFPCQANYALLLVIVIYQLLVNLSCVVRGFLLLFLFGLNILKCF